MRKDPAACLVELGLRTAEPASRGYVCVPVPIHPSIRLSFHSQQCSLLVGVQGPLVVLRMNSGQPLQVKQAPYILYCLVPTSLLYLAMCMDYFWLCTQGTI